MYDRGLASTTRARPAEPALDDVGARLVRLEPAAHPVGEHVERP